MKIDKACLKCPASLLCIAGVGHFFYTAHTKAYVHFKPGNTTEPHAKRRFVLEGDDFLECPAVLKEMKRIYK